MENNEFQELNALFQVKNAALNKPTADLIRIEIYSKLMDIAGRRGFENLVRIFREEQSELIDYYK
jgi:hypothetical protein